MIIYDITKGLLTTPVYPGDPEAHSQKVLDMDKGDAINLTKVDVCVHTGTHADAPCHFIKDGQTIDEMPLDRFIGECVVITCDGECDKAFIENAKMQGTRILLVKGDKPIRYESIESMKMLGIDTVGVECMSVGDKDEVAKVHVSLFENDITVLENLDLSKIEDGKYFLCAQPVKIEGSDGAFVRAVLIKF